MQIPQKGQIYTGPTVKWRCAAGQSVTDCLSEKPAFYPVSQKRAACVVIAADRLGADPGPLVYEIPKACWVDDKDINDWNTLSEIIETVGLPGDVVINAASRTMGFLKSLKTTLTEPLIAVFLGYQAT